tara:strand:- start:46 stop:255 length:210 start_codon:yes stop_codon:yes gene_type:complete
MLMNAKAPRSKALKNMVHKLLPTHTLPVEVGDRKTLRLNERKRRINGMDITCGCISPRRKLKNGNSVIV